MRTGQMSTIMNKLWKKNENLITWTLVQYMHFNVEIFSLELNVVGAVTPFASKGLMGIAIGYSVKPCNQ